MSVTLSLTLPPSTNALYANVRGKGRVKTKRYREWIEAAGWELASQRPGRVPGWYRLTVLIPAKASLDADNLKALSDLLKRHNVIDDDGLAWSFHVERSEDATSAQITLEAA